MYYRVTVQQMPQGYWDNVLRGGVASTLMSLLEESAGLDALLML